MAFAVFGLADDFFAVDLRVAVFRLADDFFAVDLRVAVFRLADDFFAVDLRVAVFGLADDFFAVDLRAAVFRLADDFFLIGTVRSLCEVTYPRSQSSGTIGAIGLLVGASSLPSLYPAHGANTLASQCVNPRAATAMGL